MRCLVKAGKHVSNTRAITRQLLGKRGPAATDTYATVEVFLDYKMETVFSMWLVPKCYMQSQSSSGVEHRVKAGSNTSTEALLEVGGDEK
jgi:hypothetical protein